MQTSTHRFGPQFEAQFTLFLSSIEGYDAQPHSLSVLDGLLETVNYIMSLKSGEWIIP
jgi:hypothetical protein